MELRHLRYFVAVAEALNFRRAAERLHVAQPALSKQIQQLEEGIGVRLLHRNTGGVSLTDAGAVMLDEARDILERVEMAAAAAADAANGKSGRLNVGNLGLLTASFLPGVLSAFRARYPQVDVNLIEVGMVDQLHALQTGQVHLGFMVERSVSLPAGFEWAEVLSARPAVVMNREHPLASHSSIALSELAMEPLLTVAEPGKPGRHQQYLNESLIAMVESGLGISILLPLSRGFDNVVFRPIKDRGEDLTVHLFAVWRKGSQSRILQNFLKVLKG